MNLNSSKSINEIFDKLKVVFNDIRENTGWEPVKTPNEIKVEIGEAPEYHEEFGVIRKKNKLVFGNWIDLVQPKAVSNHFWEFLIIRESFFLFFKEDLFNSNLSQLVNYILNFLALIYLHSTNPESSKDIKFYPIIGRFLVPYDEDVSFEKDFHDKLNSFVRTIDQDISYKMLYSTFMNYIEDTQLVDLDQEEILQDINRYLSNDPEEIAAPIRLKKKNMRTLLKLLELGFNTSSFKIADELNINQSTALRQIAKISSKFNSRWRLEKNYFKLGLHTNLVIIRIKLKNEKFLNLVSDELLKIKYIHQIFEGKGSKYLYLYSIIHCPHFLVERIQKKILDFENKAVIHSFEIKPIIEREYRTTIVNQVFKPSISNFRKLIFGEIPSKKIILWKYSEYKRKEKSKFDEKDINLLKFLSIIISKSLSKYGLYGAHRGYSEFLKSNNIDLNNVSEITSFLKKLENQAIERELIDYRFSISLSGFSGNDILIVKIECDPTNENISDLVEKISCFGWVGLLLSYNELFLVVLGPKYNHPLADLIHEVIIDSNLKSEIFSIKSKEFRNVSYDKLFDYTSGKWFLFS